MQMLMQMVMHWSCIWFSGTHVGDLEWVLGFGLYPAPDVEAFGRTVYGKINCSLPSMTKAPAVVNSQQWQGGLPFHVSPKEILRWDFFILLLKSQIPDRKRDREEDLPCIDLLPKCLQRPEMSQTKARSPNPLPGLSHGTGSQGFGPSSTAFPGYSQWAAWEEWRPGLEPTPIWDPGVCKARTLAVRLQCQAIGGNFLEIISSYLKSRERERDRE